MGILSRLSEWATADHNQSEPEHSPRPWKRQDPSPMYVCECGQEIYSRSSDPVIECGSCGRCYPELRNELDLVHALCPECSSKLNVGRSRERDSSTLRLRRAECPECDYEWEFQKW